MPTLHDFVGDLHNQGAINLDTPLRALVDVVQLAAPDERTLDLVVGPWYAFLARQAPTAEGLNEVASAAHGAGAVTGQSAPGVTERSADTELRIAPGQLMIQLGQIGLINLDAPLRTLLQPEGVGALALTEDRPACFIHPHYVYVHNPTL